MKEQYKKVAQMLTSDTVDIYEQTNDDIYLKAASLLKKQIDGSRRTPAGGFYHRYPDYIDQMWLVSVPITSGSRFN